MWNSPVKLWGCEYRLCWKHKCPQRADHIKDFIHNTLLRSRRWQYFYKSKNITNSNYYDWSVTSISWGKLKKNTLSHAESGPALLVSHDPGVLTTLLTYGRSFCDSPKPVHSHLASYFRGKEGVWHTMCPYAVPQSVYTAILTFNLLATSHSLIPKCLSVLLLQKPLPRYQSLLVFLKPLIRFQPYIFPVPSSMPAPSSCLFWKHVLHSTSCY